MIRRGHPGSGQYFFIVQAEIGSDGSAPTLDTEERKALNVKTGVEIGFGQQGGHDNRPSSAPSTKTDFQHPLPPSILGD